MPLTPEGTKVKAAMAKTYGPDKGERVFYASINKGRPGSSQWHGASKSRTSHSRSSSSRTRSR